MYSKLWTWYCTALRDSEYAEMDWRRYFKIPTQMALCLWWAPSAWPIRESWWACWQVWRNYRERTSRMEEIALEIVQNHKFWGSTEGNGDNLAPQKASEYSTTSSCEVSIGITSAEWVHTAREKGSMMPFKSLSKRRKMQSNCNTLLPLITIEWIASGWSLFLMRGIFFLGDRSLGLSKIVY